MGSTHSTKNENEKKISFGSYKSKTNPRPGYFITKYKVFYRGNELNDADINTFRKLKKGWAKDKNGFYYKGKRINNKIGENSKII
jgi:hypothetical protein